MSEQEAQIYEFGDFRLDAAKRLLFKRGGEPVPLTPKVFDTLLYLVENHGTVLTKEELMTAMWPDTAVEENNLGQNISKLRGVLGESRGEHRYILTVPGRGYRFVAEVKTRADAPTLAQPPAVSSIRNLAVLPFTPLVAEHRDAALELGMADALIARLGGGEIIVRPVNSVRKYVELDQDPLAAGRELGVESVLEGSIQRWGDLLRVRVRLVRVADGATLWAGTFDEKFTNIFAVQDAIAEKVAAALAPRLGREEQKRLTKRHTLSAEAYELYVRGRYHALKATPPEIQTAISYFRQAVALDPSYALAYVGLADAYRSFPLNSDMPPDEFFPRAKAALRKAVEIDDTLAEAHAVLGFTIFWYDWDWGAAENHLRRALELNPNDADTHLFYAHLLSNTGRHAAALAEAKHARELDPLNLRTNALEGQFLNHAGRADEALDRLRKTFELDSNYLLAHLFAWSAYVEKGMYGEAAAEARRARELNDVSAQPGAYLAYALAKSGKRHEAQAELDRLLELSTERFVPPYLIALVYNGLGGRDETLAWLERGYEQRDPKMVFLLVEPKWNNLRSESRFQDLLRRVGLTPEA
jgi:DNA-binding winged helix-turn-helix (wHTH) protein/tetratricopeptide (TPR) repeat protein